MADTGSITVFLADDNLIVREGVRALLSLETDLEEVGVASDYDELVAGVESTEPQVVVSGRAHASEVRARGDRGRPRGTHAPARDGHRHPVAVSPVSYAISLLADGSAGLAYLLKDSVAAGDQLARAIREVAAGGSMLDPAVVEAMVAPVVEECGLSANQEELLRLIAEGRSVNAIAAARHTTAATAADEVETVFLRLAQGASAGLQGPLERLRHLHGAIVEREELGETLSRFLPTGVAGRLREQGRRVGETERLVVTVLMSDVRGYSTIAERTDATVLAGQLHLHRAEMGRAVSAEGGTVMQFVGDAVMAVFGAPLPQDDHAGRALRAARGMLARQLSLDERWRADALAPFPLGIGLSSGEVAAALLGSDDHIEYSLVGDVVNLTQRLQAWAGGGQIVVSEATYAALGEPGDCERIEPATVKGRATPVGAYRMG